MNRAIVILASALVSTGCSVAVNATGSRGSATESSIRIRYRGNMVKGFDEIRKFDLSWLVIMDTGYPEPAPPAP